MSKEISESNYTLMKYMIVFYIAMFSFLFGMCEGAQHEREIHNIIHPECKTINPQ